MSNQYLQDRIMQVQRGRIAMGAGPAGRRAAKHNPWLSFVKEYRKECKAAGEVCDLKDAAIVYRKSGLKGRKAPARRASSKTAKRKVAAPKRRVCRKYTARKCKVKYVSGSKKNRCKKFSSRKCAKFGRGGVLLTDEPRYGGELLDDEPRYGGARAGCDMAGGCVDCPGCGERVWIT
jgi:hypothetical protein